MEMKPFDTDVLIISPEHMTRPLLTEGGGVLKLSTEAGGLDGVMAEGGGWVEDVVLSSARLSGGVRGGVGRPAVVEEEEEEEEGSLIALLRDGLLSCFCCTASSCLRSGTQIK